MSTVRLVNAGRSCATNLPRSVLRHVAVELDDSGREGENGILARGEHRCQLNLDLRASHGSGMQFESALDVDLGVRRRDRQVKPSGTLFDGIIAAIQPVTRVGAAGLAGVCVVRDVTVCSHEHDVLPRVGARPLPSATRREVLTWVMTV